MDLKKPLRDVKGQAALEYLMTYGWAILVILVVGVVLWQMGVFNQSNTPQGSRGFSQFIVLDSQYSGDQLRVFFSNEAGTKLTIDTITGSGCTLSTCTACNEEIRPGWSFDVNLTGCPTLVPGEYYKVNVQLKYLNPHSEITHTISGDVWGTTE